ncbi:Y-family DNA polymerase [Pseudoflavitalea sp. G-6-1-2]|uniref:Y-family DNA polymerase n=1 Tax=Pseudoflavitalea sp. G-6-1-2 TaxID=2728841 RepID=UPI00146B20AE|nr:Y-family DNA polymerase [Pseudoflavitalea sp. G-6-1-2]NML19633.1 Y-family DNA polymerase [Pseudoflavitalea sp. G-6-1-2]
MREVSSSLFGLLIISHIHHPINATTMATATASSTSFTAAPAMQGMKAIVDCNSFYCSCERLFRPDLRTKPVVVLSNNDGCIISRSDEARQFGVEMTGPYFEARPLIQKHNIAVFSSNYSLYGDLSWRVMETLRAIVPQVEVYSVDEAFIDLSHVPYDQLMSTAMHIRKTVEQWTGISVSIGVAPTKTLAKLANYIAKKDKAASQCVTVIATKEEQLKALKTTRVNNVWGIGWSYAEKLINQGITSAWDLSNMPEEWAHRHLGGVNGVRLIRELNGTSGKEMAAPLTTKKMIATTRMFGHPVTELNDIREAIATYTSRAAEKLRRQHGAAKTISVFLVTREENHMTTFRRGATQHSHIHLPIATAVTQELIKAAVQQAEQLFSKGKIYKKAGVMLSDIVPDDSVQGNLFAPPSENDHRFLMSVIDNVNFSMRDDMLKFASSGTTRDWKMRQELRSKRFTTRWEELFEVK